MCCVPWYTAAAEVVKEDGLDVSLRRERVMPFRSAGSIVSYTIHVQPPAKKVGRVGLSQQPLSLCFGLVPTGMVSCRTSNFNALEGAS
jgi:hypothetical protein